MPWRNGGVIGQRNLPTQAAASGVWRLSEIESAQRGLAWPVGEIASPSEVPGLVLWLDGADETTMYDATTGGSLVAADATIARWQDKSGNNRHFTQGTSGLRPFRRSAVKNGLGAVGFLNDWMSGTYTYTAGSVFVVWNHPTTVAGDTLPRVICCRTGDNNKVGNSDLNYGVMLPSASTVAVDPFVGAGTHRLNGVTQGANFNNFSVGVTARTSPDRWQYTNSTFMAKTGQKAIVVGADTFQSARFMQDGHVGEILAYSSLLSAGQVALIERHLVRKWGLA